MSSFVTAGETSFYKSSVSDDGQNMSHQNVNLKFLACCHLLVHGSSSGNSSTGCPLLSFTHPELGHGVMWMTQSSIWTGIKGQMKIYCLPSCISLPRVALLTESLQSAWSAPFLVWSLGQTLINLAPGEKFLINTFSADLTFQMRLVRAEIGAVCAQRS